ncbi:MAG: hypothetical protein HZB16_10335 [Armatimonadetes bacterium]|nr:hypothetical protein [Armatimonadota bacterium]
MRRALLPLLVLLTCCSACLAQKQRHDQIVAVPVPGRITVDGSLKDWDLSGAIDSAYDDALRPRFSGRFALMYDAGALYLGAHLVDETPLRNRHDPAVEINRGWDGDCLQMRLGTNPAAPFPAVDGNGDEFVHLDLWYYTDRRLPVLKLDWGMDHHGATALTGAATGTVFRTDDDGAGYTIEARIPWSVLKAAAPPKAGSRLAFTLQPLWGDAAGWKQVTTYYEVVRGAGFAFQTASVWGQCLLSPTGHLKPTERPRSAGEVAEPLRLSLTLPDPRAASVSLGVFGADGALVRTLPAQPGGQSPLTVAWDGLDDDGRPLPAGSYALKLLSHRGLGQRWVGSLHNAGDPPWRTDDGRGAWGGDHGAPIAACADAKRVYLGWELSEAGTAIVAVETKLNAGRPRKLWGQQTVLEIGMLCQAMASDGERLFVAQDGRRWGQGEGGRNTCGVVLWEGASGKPLNFPFGKRCLVVSDYEPGKSEATNLTAIAVRGDRLYCALAREDKIVCLDWKTGQRGREFALAQPHGLALDASGALIATSGGSLLRLDPETGQTAKLADGLAEPHSVAIDAAGRILVSERGRAQTVRVFDAKGAPLAVIGKPGGRPGLGRYEPLGLYQPAGLCADSDGKLWVTEQDFTPKRVSVWSSDGKLLADLHGPGAYAVESAADPARPGWVTTHNVLYDLDYATGASRCLATLVRAGAGQIQPFGGFMGRSLRFAHAGGRDYLVWPGHGIAIVYLLRADLTAQPVAAVGYLKDAPLYGFQPEWFSPEQRPLYERERFGSLFRWADTNGDGQVQADEMLAAKAPQVYHGYWGPWVEDDLTLWFPGAASGAWRLAPESWLANGAPVYPAPAAQKPLLATLGNCVHAMPASDGVYVLERRGGNEQTAAGAEWMAVSLYGVDGTRRWAYRRVWTDFALEAPLYRPGMVIGAMKFIGRATLASGLEVVAVNGYPGQFNLLAHDGLWIGALCHDNRYGPKADAGTVWPENFSGWFFRNRNDGKVYLMAGDTDARCWEITGLDTIARAQQPLTLTAADHELAVAAARARQATAARAPLAIARRGATWDETRQVSVEVDGRRSYKVALAYDATSLHVRFDVRDDSPLANAGRDDALLFKTGDAADMMLAQGDGSAPLRLLFSVLDGTPVAVVYQPKTPPGLAEARREFSSPTGSESFARVARLAGAKVTLTREAAGYRLEATVPLAELGLTLAAGQKLRGDVGVIFSDAGGSRNALRSYWFNQDTAIVNDLPSEARLQPAKWGAVNVE